MNTLAIYEGSLFGFDFSFDSVAFTLPIGGGWKVYWYGICIALGFLLAVIYCFKRAKRFDIDVDRLIDVVLVTAPLAVLCARIYYVIFDGEKITSFKEFIGFGSDSGVAGLAIYGGVIGAAVIGLAMCKLRKVNVLDAFDLAASGFLIGQCLGRWGNFFNQEAFGSITEHGMMSNGIVDYIKATRGEFPEFDAMRESEISDYIAEEGLCVHPTFLYESLWCLLGFVLLHFIGNRRKFKGQLALSYGVWYGFGRMIIEGLRTDSLFWGPLKVSQWLSGGLVLVCGILLIYNLVRLKNAKKALTYETMFDEIENDGINTMTFEEATALGDDYVYHDEETDEEAFTEDDEAADEDVQTDIAEDENNNTKDE